MRKTRRKVARDMSKFLEWKVKPKSIDKIPDPKKEVYKAYGYMYGMIPGTIVVEYTTGRRECTKRIYWMSSC